MWNMLLKNDVVVCGVFDILQLQRTCTWRVAIYYIFAVPDEETTSTKRKAKAQST
jgi:hypothetical protein